LNCKIFDRKFSCRKKTKSIVRSKLEHSPFEALFYTMVGRVTLCTGDVHNFTTHDRRMAVPGQDSRTGSGLKSRALQRNSHATEAYNRDSNSMRLSSGLPCIFLIFVRFSARLYQSHANISTAGRISHRQCCHILEN